MLMRTSKTSPELVGPGVALWLAVAAGVLFGAGVTVLRYRHDDPFAWAAAGLIVVVVAAALFVVHTSRDRRAAARLALSREVDEYRHVFEKSLDLIFVTDRKGMFTRVNPSAETILGYRPDEMVGRLASAFIDQADL